MNFNNIKQEPFCFSWAGKQKAKELAFKQSETNLSLKFDEKRGKNTDTTENLIIEGDNLDVLKLLLPSYKDKVKCIYIDPPYNGQKKFIYSDNYAMSKVDYLRESGQQDILYQSQNEINAGRKHSNWLSFMYPRLVLARELLREDGVIFISIDDNEVHHLRLIMNEVFGEECSTENIIWESKTKSQNTKSAYNKLQPKTEYILVYSKLLKNEIRFNLLTTGSKEYPETDEKGVFRYKIVGEMNANGIRGRKSMIFPINGINPKQGKQWQLGQDAINEYSKRDDIVIKDNQVFLKMRPEDERTEITAPFWALFLKDIGTAESAKQDLDKLMDVDNIFDTVKPINLIKQLIFHSTAPNDLILDFFAGSGTTGQAVMELNQEEIDKQTKDGLLADKTAEAGGRKFILVQLPEKIDDKKEAFKAGYKYISDITIERVRRAGEKYKGVDNGFKVLQVTESAVNQTLIDSYYNDGISLIPDSEYDLLFAGDPNHKEKPTRTSKMTIKHLIPMLSIKKYKSLNEVPKTITHNKNLLKTRHETPKIDGVAIQVIYNKGTLESIQTRGNGIFGVDIQSKVVNLLPKDLISCAGDLYPNHSHIVFRAEVYTSPENAKLYDLEHRECSHSYLMKKVTQIDPKHIGIFIHSFNPIIQDKVIQPSFEKYISVTHLQPLPTGHEEGVAFHYFTDRDIEIVFTNKSHYTLCNAFKFDQKESVSVVVEEIIITYNKLGKECRVAKFAPTTLNSKTISKAFLYNDTKTKVGDKKTLYLAGNIIPKLVDY